MIAPHHVHSISGLKPSMMARPDEKAGRQARRPFPPKEIVSPQQKRRPVMKQSYAIATSMLMLALVLIGAQTHALFMSSGATDANRNAGLRASVVETLNSPIRYRQDDNPPVPFDRGAPNPTIH